MNLALPERGQFDTDSTKAAVSPSRLRGDIPAFSVAAALARQAQRP